MTTGGGRAPVWSRRGEIAFVRRGTILRLDPGTGRTIALAQGERPDFSPSGLTVLYAQDERVYSRSIRPGARRRLRLRSADRAVFSPDGRRLAYVRRTGDAGRRDFFLSVFTARADGTGEHVLRRGREQPVGSTFANYVDVAWRPLR